MSIDLAGPLLLVGAGKMGGAMLRGWLDGGLDPKSVHVLDPAPSPEMAALFQAHGIEAGDKPEPGLEPAIVVLAVKPQILGAVMPEIESLVGPDTVVLSIAAGKTLGFLEEHLPKGAAAVRAMPNTPAAIGQGVTAVCANAHVTPAMRTACEALLQAAGSVHWIENEDLMDAVTAVSGSGPAYVFLLTECMAEAGVELGLDRELAAALARETVSGAGALMAGSKEEAGQLRQNVTSPQGVTAAALEVLMEKDAMPGLLKRALAKAAARSGELSS
ncbi:pyrroline-5-carboxylate reductase [Methyloligella sp. 2.7D]|uniref:pyrroline-5-carboxylate reductase n=1 Tax=unclassified Methyloligella TaxID=2625955 RepID=UPI00157D3973|nr:pyrroline-5-carboxylate reductase [Methyloligella sp. GL2]QKP77041.1 pyrroline-5-carboxylate reductase [Methyloligella sp. GL2]